MTMPDDPTHHPSHHPTHDGAATMTVSRFAALADAYGGDIGRWPAAERTPANQMLAGSEAARTMLAAAQHLDAALSRLAPPPPASVPLKDRVAALRPAPAHRARNRSNRPRLARFGYLRLALFGRGLAFAAAAAAGIWGGILLAPARAPVGDDLALIEAALIVGAAPSAVVGELVEDD